MSWRQSRKLAIHEPLSSVEAGREWSEHRVGIITDGERAGNYIAVQASEDEGWNVLISRNNKRRISVGYPATPDSRLRTLLSPWGVCWLPQGLYADAVTSKFFQRAAQGEEAL